MGTTPNKPEDEPAPLKPANAKPPDNVSASVPDTLATLHVNPDIGGLITVAMGVGVAMTAEGFLLLWFCGSRFGLSTNNNFLYTFSFLTLLYLAAFSIVSARERRWFWATMPSKALVGPSWRIRSRAPS
ncbi:MAG: hypothetical protein WBN92_08495 [Terriglobia bacterium]